MADIPHFDYPFRFGTDGHAAVVEQDDDDDVRNCVIAILKTDLGFRDELPEFGVPHPFLRENGANINGISSAINRWEPRADATLDAGEVRDMIQNVTVSIARRADA